MWAWDIAVWCFALCVRARAVRFQCALCSSSSKHPLQYEFCNIHEHSCWDVNGSRLLDHHKDTFIVIVCISFSLVLLFSIAFYSLVPFILFVELEVCFFFFKIHPFKNNHHLYCHYTYKVTVLVSFFFQTFHWQIVVNTQRFKSLTEFF